MKKDKYIIAGIPRSGTTYFIRAIQGLSLGVNCPRNKNSIGIRTITERGLNKDYTYYKTHDFAPEALPSNIRCVFLFSNLVDSIVSTKRKRFTKSHFLNCHYSNSKTKDNKIDIYNRDDLNYEKMFKTWTKPKKGYPVLALRYETMDRYHSEIEDFLGFKFLMPKFKVRKPYQINTKLRQKIQKTYFNLLKMIREYPDIKVIE